jgi:hypothetical protein
LKEHVGIQFARASQHGDVIPASFLSNCKSIFEKNKHRILENIIEGEMSIQPKTYEFTDIQHELYFVVSTFPWSKSEAIEGFLNMSTERPFGYVNLFTQHINDRPNTGLTNFCHLLVLLGDQRFEIHICLSQMRTMSPKDGFEFTLYPIELLNDEEKRLAGLE